MRGVCIQDVHFWNTEIKEFGILLKIKQEYEISDEDNVGYYIPNIGWVIKEYISIVEYRDSQINPNYNHCHDKIHIIDKDLLYQKYITENLSLNKCSVFFKTSKSTIFLNLKKHDITKDKEVWKSQLSANPKKVILQYDLKGNLIKEWIGLKSIDIKNSNISNCCRGLTKTTSGFIWRYKENFIDLGLNNLYDNKRKIKQYNLSGEFIDSFISITEASNKLNINNGNIVDCCVGRLKSAGGYMFRYYDDQAPDKYKNKVTRCVIQYDKDMNFISEYSSIIEAERITKSRSNCITSCCSGVIKSAGGFIWKYKD